jgi:diguanylate cyclase (GGDEF)-like protein
VLFEDRLQQSLFRAARSRDRCVAVLFVDIDRFKNINDSFGHAAGDHLLREIGRRLLRAVRRADTVARMGGDEFTVLLDSVRGEAEAQEVTRRIQEAMRLPVEIAGADIVVSASIGLTLSGPDDRRPADLLRDADTAMYRAKSRGRDRIIIFEPSMHEEVLGLVQLEQELRHGIASGQLLLHYQPIVALPSRRLIGFEALVRWDRPGQGVALPGEFLHVAREAGLMPDLERWVLDTACDQIATWRQDGGLSDGAHVAVNVSPERLIQPGLLTQVRDALDRTGIPPRSLRLEITESSLLHDEIAASIAVRELRALGVRVCLDDFGTGYSSLAYIHRFRVDVLKIDRTFVTGLPLDQSSDAIIRAILGMAHGLGLEVVAEGVETEAQLTRLVELGCTIAQGYYLGRPSGPGSRQEPG